LNIDLMLSFQGNLMSTVDRPQNPESHPRAKGMTPMQHAELLGIIGLAAKTNQLAVGLQVSVDPVFDRG
jgi:alkylhydroperoxidase family enzyme